MLGKLGFIILLAALGLISYSTCFAQGADNKNPMVPRQDDDDDRPKGFKETLERLRIDKEKKEFDEMIGRGEDAAKLSDELEKAYARNGRLENQDISKVAAVEKLVKKIRSELGGDDGDDEDSNSAATPAAPERGEMIKSLRDTTLRLLDELKKTSRFTVSAAAIQTSNSVLKLARILRITK